MRRVVLWCVIPILVVLGGVVVLASWSGDGTSSDAAPRPAPEVEPWWAGPAVAGLPVTADGDTVFYGDCDPGPGEGGCSPPVQIQTRTTCGRNPVDDEDGTARRLSRLPGGAIRNGPDISTGDRTLSVYANTRALADEARRGLRPRSTMDPLATLPPPVFPEAALAELRRVQAQYRRSGSLAATKRALGIPERAIRQRLRLLELLPADVLRGVALPRLSVREVERRRQAVIGLVDGLRPDGVDARTLARWERSVRGLAGGC